MSALRANPGKSETDSETLRENSSRLRVRTRPRLPPPARPGSRTAPNLRKSVMLITIIRICLNENGTVHYFPYYDSTEDYGGELAPAAALDLLRSGVPAELACDAPGRPDSHFETLDQQVTFFFI